MTDSDFSEHVDDESATMSVLRRSHRQQFRRIVPNNHPDQIEGMYKVVPFPHKTPSLAGVMVVDFIEGDVLPQLMHKVGVADVGSWAFYVAWPKGVKFDELISCGHSYLRDEESMIPRAIEAITTVFSTSGIHDVNPFCPMGVQWVNSTASWEQRDFSEFADNAVEPRIERGRGRIGSGPEVSTYISSDPSDEVSQVMSGKYLT